MKKSRPIRFWLKFITETPDETEELRKKEEELRRELGRLQHGIHISHQLMNHLQNCRALQIDLFRQRIDTLKQQEEECRAEMMKLRTHLESLRRQAQDLVKRKDDIVIAINVMTQRKPSEPDVKVEIAEDVKPALQRFRTELPVLMEEIQRIRQQEEELTVSLGALEDSAAAIQQLLLIAGEDWRTAETSATPAYTARMQQLVDDQKDRSFALLAIEKELADVGHKLRSICLEKYFIMGTEQQNC